MKKSPSQVPAQLLLCRLLSEVQSLLMTIETLSQQLSESEGSR